MTEKLYQFVARKFQISEEIAKKEIIDGLVLINEEPFTNPDYEIKPEAEEKIVHKERHIYSVSQLKKYMKCPYSYKLAYIDKLESEKVFIGTMLGSTFHKCIELGVDSDDLEKITEIFNEIKQEYIDKGVKISLPPKGKKHKHLTDKEWELHLVCDAINEVSNFLKVMPEIEIDEHEQEINFLLDKYPFVGYIDIVATIGDEKAIIDLKTTYSYNYFNPQDYRLQLALYCYATGIRQAMLFVFSRNDEEKIKIFRYKFSEDEIAKWVELAKKISFAIENEIFWKKEAKWVWNWMYKKMTLTDNWCDRVCGFREHCFGKPPEKETK